MNNILQANRLLPAAKAEEPIMVNKSDLERYRDTRNKPVKPIITTVTPTCGKDLTLFSHLNGPMDDDCIDCNSDKEWEEYWIRQYYGYD